MTEPSSQSPWSAPGSAPAGGPSPSAGQAPAGQPSPPPGYGPPPGYPPPGYAPPAYGPPPGYHPGAYAPPGYPHPGYGYAPPGYASPPGYGPPPGYPQLGYGRQQPSGPAVLVPERIDALPGTDFGIAYAAVAPISSGQSVGSMLAGIASIVVALVELSFGLGGAAGGWGPLIAGAFGILALLLGGAALVSSRIAARAISRSGGLLHGLGIARAGTILGGIGVGLTVLGFAGSLLATYAG